jgi:hypothetical protein
MESIKFILNRGDCTDLIAELSVVFDLQKNVWRGLVKLSVISERPQDGIKELKGCNGYIVSEVLSDFKDTAFKLAFSDLCSYLLKYGYEIEVNKLEKFCQSHLQLKT